MSEQAIVAYSPIREEHGTLSHDLVRRIFALLNESLVKPEVSKYHVDALNWSGPYESILLTVGKDQVELTLRKGK